MIRTTIACVALLAVTLAARPVQSAGPCAPTGTEVAGYLLSDYRWMMQGDEEARVSARTRTKVPKVDSASVAFVTDTTVCRAAAVAYTAVVGDSSSSRVVHVLQIGNRYVVHDPFTWAGQGAAPRMTFDSTFTVPPLAVLY
ncbi:MAG TPA: hypothetical protein VGT98_07800 [Candidatus Elarobacter sp.]|nr:hypothetical protein [Candidatus Elarobacter sp.]